MKIAIVGAGISGLVCSRLLSRSHDITVFEASPWIGGHANTVSVQQGDSTWEVDTGFIVYNSRTYPDFNRILDDLDVATSPTSMSFSVRCDRTGLEYNGTSLNGVFAQRGNLFRPSFHRLIRDILRFNREGAEDVGRVPVDQTVGDYLVERGYSSQFSDQYLLPMGAAIWSCPCDDFAVFPIQFILEFYVNHGLLSLKDRPVWRVVDGGSQRYVEKLIEPFRDRIRTETPVTSVIRSEGQVTIDSRAGLQSFDEVIFACHSDQALKLLSDPDDLESAILSEFPYSSNTAVLHTDERVLPRLKRAWASWNYHIPVEPGGLPTVTYNMSMLQRLESAETFCVTLNEEASICSDKVIARFNYEHPLFTTRRSAIQQRHDEVIRRRRTSFCGAYWRNGFHEDGVVSALAVCRKFGIDGWDSETAGINPQAARTTGV